MNFAFANQKSIEVYTYMYYYSVYGVSPVQYNKNNNIYECIIMGDSVLFQSYIPAVLGLKETRAISIANIKKHMMI